jgi:hypothetical protein
LPLGAGRKRFYLKWYDDFLPSAGSLCPKTVELLNAIPSVHGAMFAMLPPGGKLGAHRDPFAGSLRYHLGLVTPNSNKCRILVDGVVEPQRLLHAEIRADGADPRPHRDVGVGVILSTTFFLRRLGTGMNNRSDMLAA